MAIVLSSNLNYLINYSKNQFKQNKGLHLNSADWKTYVSVGPAIYYSFLVNGTLKWHTNSAISGEKYEQLMKISDYKRIEPALLMLYLLKINEQTILDFIKKSFSLSNCRICCSCPAYQYWGPHYNLTKVKSQYGEPEIRKPDKRDVTRNNLVCKHLWLVLTNFETNMDKFVKDLLPYYKRYFGLNSPTSIERTLKALGEKGIFKTYENAKKLLLEFKDKQLYDDYVKIIDAKLNNMFNQVKQIEQKPTEQPKEVNKEEVEKDIEKMEQELKPEEKIKESESNKEEENNKEETTNDQENNSRDVGKQ